MAVLQKGTLKERLLENYSGELDHSGVSGERVASRLSLLSEIGATADGGSCRIGFSTEERQAKELVKSWMREAGLKVREDAAGNVIAVFAGSHPNEPVVLSGSHLDSVPNGGHFDGPLGVLCALEVAEAWKESGYQPHRSYEMIIFSDEEGARFNGGLTGSQAFTGELELQQQLKLKDGEGKPFEQVVREYGLAADRFLDAQRDLTEIAAFIEVHIEQGKVLENKDVPVGVVTGIAGPKWIKFSFKGSADHAGNTPMNDRKDALVASSWFVYELSGIPKEVSPTAVATAGKVEVFPNGINVIPGQADVYVDMRDISEASVTTLSEKIIQKAQEAAQLHGMAVEYNETLNVAPVPIQTEMQHLLLRAVEEMKLTPVLLPSGAAHDTMVLARYVPAAMLFVRSQEGISHHPDEWTTLDDCVQAVHVLKKAIESLVSR